tara:strand:+ start:66 stop:1619 length:1554 start_codon:yes stop_codon:yes gene_type:complete
MVSAGNQAVLGQEDFLEFFVDDPLVRAIGLHIEGLQDVPRFESAALKALSKGIPVVVLKTGSSTIGSELTISHTGSLSGSAELYEALFARTGIISVSNPSQFLETLKFLCVVGAPKSKNLVGFTCSGGGATMLADYAEKIDLSFLPVDPVQEIELAALLPKIATVSNPLDYTTPIWGQEDLTYPVFSKAILAVEAGSAVLVQDYPAEGLDNSKVFYQRDAIAFARATKESGLPAAICATIPENMDIETRQLLISKGVAPMQGIHETLNAISASAEWSQNRVRILLDIPRPLSPNLRVGQQVMVSEPEGKSWLLANDFAVPQGKVTSGQNLGAVASELGYPLALKMVSPYLPHKTEAGAVVLNLSDAASAIQASIKMQADVVSYNPQAATDQFLLEAMSPKPLAELIVTLRRDPQFGIALVLGSGGILVELVGDAVTLLLPLSPHDITRAIKKLRVIGLLNGFRGGPQADLEKISLQIHRLCIAYTKHQDEIAEIEINPLFIYSDQVCAVDVLVHKFN